MSGLHHVTAIAGPALQNKDFYTRVLGLRLVKRTVNFDDPGTWHLYFGDEDASPGTLITFFPWAQAAPGHTGGGETVETRFAVPAGSLKHWEKALPYAQKAAGKLVFRDPDGMALALMETETGEGTAITGIAGVKLAVPEIAPTAGILTAVLGFEPAADNFFATGESHVELEAAPGLPRGRLGRGSVHHIAFRARDDADQERMAELLRTRFNIHPTEQRDRNYFRSIYFREPGGVLFEIATDGPGFAVDEPAAHMGEKLMLPSFLEPKRAQIAAVLPSLD